MWGFNAYDKAIDNGTVDALFAPIAQKLVQDNGTTIIYSSEVRHYDKLFESWKCHCRLRSSSSWWLGSRLTSTSPCITDGRSKRLAQLLQDLAKPAEGSVVILEVDTAANDNAAMIEEAFNTAA
jgi:hypothetical protein